MACDSVNGIAHTYAEINGVQVWNADNCSVASCSSRLSGVRVKVDGVMCGELSGSTSIQTVTCNRQGSKVLLVTPRKGSLSLCEVKVYAGGSSICHDMTTPSGQPWHDSTSPAHTCDWYRSADLVPGISQIACGSGAAFSCCAMLSGIGEQKYMADNYGMTANQACCFCNGGRQSTSPLFFSRVFA